MTDLTAKAAELADKMKTQNPSSSTEKPPEARRRIPMTAPQRKLEVQKIPGYYLQWVRGDSARVQQALNAGFEFVTPEEQRINSRILGDDALKSGSTDMGGSRVSIVDGTDVGQDGQAVRLYLMKQREEDREEDQAINQTRNDRIADALTAAYRTGQIGVGAAGAPAEMQTDVDNRYVDAKRSRMPKLFQRKR